MPLKKILIVDDEPDVVNYLTAVLESNGYRPYSAQDIKTAMQIVKKIHPDLICLDIVMPKETGISFYLKLQQEKKYKNIPVMIISGIIESEKFNFRTYVKDESVPLPQCYMEKPVDIKNFIFNIEQLTG
jgi:DNA-binding response OmpR family regulator